MTVPATDLCTVQDVKAYLSLTTATDDAMLQTIVSGASTVAQTFIGYNLLQQEYTEAFTGLGKYQRTVRVNPIISVTSVSVDGQAIPASPGSNQAGWLCDKETVYLNGYQFSKGSPLNCSITYQGGYASVPDDVKEAIIEMVASKYKRRGRIGQSSLTIGRETIAYLKNDLSDENKDALKKYQLVQFG